MAAVSDTQIKQNDEFKTSRLLYVIESAVEYFIAILIGSTYLAKLATTIGISDGTTGVLTAFVSLGFGFQIFALFLAGKKKVKHLIIIIRLIYQFAFTCLYLVPLFDISTEAKTVIFILFLLFGEIAQNCISPAKATWQNNLIDNRLRGSFTAKKEIVSLLTGVVVSMSVGSLMDYFEAQGKLETSFIISAILIFIFMVSDAALLLFTKEKEINAPKTNVKAEIKAAITDKNLLAIIPLFVLWSIASSSTTPFYGTYQIKELGFSMTFIAVLSFVYAIVRALFSVPMGKFADKYSFVKMLNICFAAIAVGFLINVFTTPNGLPYLSYTSYYVLYAISMAGINSGTVNLVYDYTPISRRTGSLAIKNTVVGFAGFFTTLACKPLVDFIQKNGNRFLGISDIYAQQVLSVIGCVFTVLTIVYMNIVVKKLQRPDEMLRTDDADLVLRDARK